MCDQKARNHKIITEIIILHIAGASVPKHQLRKMTEAKARPSASVAKEV